MSFDRRLYPRLNSTSEPGQSASLRVPGKETLSSQVQGPSYLARAVPETSTSYNEQEKASSAAVAVNLARQSTGAPLPFGLQEKFEASTGADLSGVRVHTGHPSAQATSAVNARAYATGNDIHFAPGEYNPQSKEGQRLIAHEVAHTVQQSGSGGGVFRSGDANKLNVSQPGDHHEVEADRAADAMLSGAPARLSRVSAGVMQRDVSQDMRDASRERETHLGDAFKAGHGPAVLSTSNVDSISSAQSAVRDINNADADILRGIHASDLPESMHSTNQAAVRQLNTYIAESGVVSSTMGDFHVQYQRTLLDWHRLVAAMTTFQAAHPGDYSSSTGGAQGRNVLRNSGITDADRNRRSQNLDGGAAGSTSRDTVQRIQSEMSTLASNLGAKQSDMTAANRTVMARAHEVEAGVVPREAPDAVAKANQIKAKVERIKGYATSITSFATSKVAAMIGTGVTAVTSAVVGAVVNDGFGATAGERAGGIAASQTTVGLNDLVGYIATLPWQRELGDAQRVAQDALDGQHFAAFHALTDNLNAAKDTLVAKTQEYVTHARDLQQKKQELREAMLNMGRAADAGSHSDNFSQIAVMLGEASTFVAQTDATIALGDNEARAEQQAQVERARISGQTVNYRWQEGQNSTWYRARWVPYARYYRPDASPSNSLGRWVADPQSILLTRSQGMRSDGTNSAIQNAVTQLREYRQNATEFRNQLASEFPSLVVDPSIPR